MDKFVFQGENGPEEYVILDQTKLLGRVFLLVTPVEEGEGDCFIFEEIPGACDRDFRFEIVEDEELLDHLANIFGEQIDDFDIEY